MTEITDILNKEVYKIALYGLGAETEKTLCKWSGRYNVVGLLDSFKTEGELYGYPIISLEDTVRLGVEIIIVAARPGSCKAITANIGTFCRENQIALYDIRGKNLLEKTKVVYSLDGIRGETKEELCAKIIVADVVSFDLFDTLIMRMIPSVTDIFEMVECRAKDQGINITDFVNKRLLAEKELSRDKAPRLFEIYQSFTNDDNARMLAEIEFNVDLGLIVARVEMCEVFHELILSGKTVCITSDTYYNEEQICKIIRKAGIDENVHLLLSCEKGRGKTKSLFECLKEFAPYKRYLHVGDDIVADIEAAKVHGIDSYKVYSAWEMFDAVGTFGLEEHIHSLSDKLRVGLFVATIFNNPFQFEEGGGKIKITTAYDIGYLFCAPMIVDFIIWLRKKVQNERISNVWFCARDGYLVQKLYHELAVEAKTTYFLTSRIAAIRAGVQTEKELMYIESMRFSGTLEKSMRDRFGISAEELQRVEAVNDCNKDILKYYPLIVERAERVRKGYSAYIETLNLRTGDILMFDFVAKGTTQYFVQKLVRNHVKGAYFLQLEPEFMCNMDLEITSFYTVDEMKNSAIYDSYYILETILTSPDASVIEFTEEGKPIYAHETRKKENIACVCKAQQGITDYFRNYLSLCHGVEKRINKKLDEELLKLICAFEITDQEFLRLVVEDPFFNRMTNIVDVI